MNNCQVGEAKTFSELVGKSLGNIMNTKRKRTKQKMIYVLSSETVEHESSEMTWRQSKGKSSSLQ